MAEDDLEFRRRLASLVQAWREEGLIDESQAAALLAREGVRPARFLAAVRLGLLITALSLIGAAAVGAGVILLVAANWKAGEETPAYVKAGLLFAGVGACYLAGYLLQFRTGVQPRVGAAIILLGAVLFQAAIFLLEQTYNMPVDDPIGLLLGAAGILPLAYLIGSRFILFLGLLDLTAWGAWHVQNQYPDSPEIVALPLALVLIGIAYYGLGHLHRRWPSFAGFTGIYVGVGLLLALGTAYVLTFGEIWEGLAHDFPCKVEAVYYRCQDYDHSGFSPASQLFYLTALAVVAVVGGALSRRVRGIASVGETALLLVFIGVVGLAAARPWFPLAVPFNLLFFAAALGCVYRGYLEADNKFIYVGLGAVGVGLVTRYAESAWDLVPRGGFFIAGGALLLAVAAATEVARRRLLRRAGGGRGVTE